MDNSIFIQNRDFLTNLISQNQEIGIIIGEQHDLDKVAASLALYLVLRQIGKDVQIVSKKDPIVEFSNLVGIDKIRKEFTGMTKNLTISLPYTEGEIEKVSYKIEGNRLNINLFAGENKITFSEKDIEYIRRGENPSVVFAVSVSSADKIYEFTGANPEVKIVNIDNNKLNNAYGDVVYVDSLFSSVSEIAGKIIQELGLPVDIDSSQNLLDGVSSATDNFSSYSTSPYAFEVVSFVLKHGAKRQSLAGEDYAAVKTASNSGIKPVVKTDMESNNDYEEKTGDDFSGVPQDWFAPKIFRGTSKKQE